MNKIIQLNNNENWTTRIIDNINYFKNKEIHRKIYSNEIVWDIDCKISPLKEKIVEFISNFLEHENLSHSIWRTQTKNDTFHIHLFIDDLLKYNKNQRGKIRHQMLKYYSSHYINFVDFKTENCNIRDFYSINTHNNKPKIHTKIVICDLKNKIPNHILNQVLQLKQFESNLFHVANNVFNIELAKKLLNVSQAKRFDLDSQRNTRYFKNIAIAVFKLKIDEDEIKKIFKQIIQNCRGKKINELYGWLKWCSQQSHDLKINYTEIKRFIE